MSGPAYARGHQAPPTPCPPHPESITSPILVGSGSGTGQEPPWPRCWPRVWLNVARAPVHPSPDGGLLESSRSLEVEGRGGTQTVSLSLVASRPLLSAGDPHRPQTFSSLKAWVSGLMREGQRSWSRESWESGPVRPRPQAHSPGPWRLRPGRPGDSCGISSPLLGAWFLRRLGRQSCRQAEPFPRAWHRGSSGQPRGRLQEAPDPGPRATLHPRQAGCRDTGRHVGLRLRPSVQAQHPTEPCSRL